MIRPDIRFELEAWKNGHQVVVGVDEVGRGAWAGPVVAAAVQLLKDAPVNSALPSLLRDSKKLSSNQRLQLVENIKQRAIQIAIGVVDVDDINQIGIGRANFLAMSRALDGLPTPADFILIDGFRHPDISPSRQKSVIKGDSLVASIAAASVVAKVYRDKIMEDLSQTMPEYDFAKHKGYGTATHQQAILKFGLSPAHRKNYKLKFLSTTNNN